MAQKKKTRKVYRDKQGRFTSKAAAAVSSLIKYAWGTDRKGANARKFMSGK